MRALLIFACLLLLAPIPPATAAPPPLHLEASTARSEFVAGDMFTISAHLFNDGTTPTRAVIGIEPPAGFALIRITPVLTTTPLIAPGRAIGAYFSYWVAATTPKGIHRVTVLAYDDAGLWIPGLAREVVIRVGPIESPPPRPPPRRIRLPMVRG